MINYLVIGIFLTADFPSVPNWPWVPAAIGLVTGMNVVGVKLVARRNLVLVGFQVVFLAVFFLLSFRNIAGDGVVSFTDRQYGHPEGHEGAQRDTELVDDPPAAARMPDV